MQEILVRFLGQEDPRKRDRLLTLVFLGFPGGLDSKESTCNVGDLSSIPGFGKMPWRREWLPIPAFGLEASMAGYSPWGLQRVRYQ